MYDVVIPDQKSAIVNRQSEIKKMIRENKMIKTYLVLACPA